MCLEATGVYSEVLAHFLVANGYPVAVEPPLKVKRAFKPAGHKSDPVDSPQIAEYAYRFWDQLSLWAPRRRSWSKSRPCWSPASSLWWQRTGHQNACRALKRKAVRTPLAEQLHEKAIAELKGHIQALEAEIRRLIDQDPDFRHLVGSAAQHSRGGAAAGGPHAGGVPVGSPSPARPSAWRPSSGICPYEDSSGTSLHHHPDLAPLRSTRVAQTVVPGRPVDVATHNPAIPTYFLRKSQEGKPKQLVINNIANKLLKVMVAVVRSKTAFIPNYRSVNPGLLKQALTKS